MVLIAQGRMLGPTGFKGLAQGDPTYEELGF